MAGDWEKGSKASGSGDTTQSWLPLTKSTRAWMPWTASGLKSSPMGGLTATTDLTRASGWGGASAVETKLHCKIQLRVRSGFRRSPQF